MSPTPRLTGRLTLNPMAHLDPVGTLLMILTGFGWAKPVEINARYYNDPKKGMAMTAAAGPVMNLILAFVAMLIYTIIYIIAYKTSFISIGVLSGVGSFLYLFASVNLMFMVFNIIPIPPLDGSRVAGLILPSETYFKLQRFERYSFILIIVLSLTGVFSAVIGSGVNLFMKLILNICDGLAKLVI